MCSFFLMYRDKINGPRTINHGRIAKDCIADFDSARQLKSLLESVNPDFTYEITGVNGDYKIIEREINRRDFYG